ncbi:MAG: aldo/keto reductase [Vulcanisaeta sp.]|jgi:Aldo/keto reductases, related to diketogulonate reductase|nr:aldo/keto reductase [Vulcanisaeta sp. EB80]MCG2865181.1 aldo/keto reductase [Vulcanisaeta sp.]MCG2866912.1 aldo/keto reductase [Vulcanisaeta sp.]MCG2885822.1 aldo/keto reductase [Vulcanisaeta sp.]MDT7863142.1 aldo/keto reductase [Vulcanisaeta sp.]
MSLMRDTKYIKSINGKVSAIGMGTWGIGGGYWSPDYSGDDEWVRVLREGIGLGMTLIDTAEMYGGGHTEEIVGRSIKGFPREELFIVSKVWPNHARYDDVLRSARASANRLGTYIDLYLLHWPAPDVPICETMRAMERLVDDGVIRFFGLSNFDVNGIEEARSCLSKYDVAAVENRYSLLHRVDESSVIPYVQRNGMLYLAYTPIEKGAFSNNEFLMGIGKKYGKTAIQVVLNWYVGIDNLVPIPKAGRVEHVRENAGAMGWRLSRDDWELISNHFH